MKARRASLPLALLATALALAGGDTPAGAPAAPPTSPTPPMPAPAWRPLGDNLYTNDAGELGYRVLAAGERRGVRVRYLTHLDFDGRVRLADVVDVATFRRLGDSNFHCDRHHLYQYYGMSDGGRLSLFDSVAPGVDRASFVVLGSFYARDRRRVYAGRGGWMRAADAATFTVLEGALARDRHRHYLWGAPATPAEVAAYREELRALRGGRRADTPAARPVACTAGFSGNSQRPRPAANSKKQT